jgi:hypothetical protein
MARQLGAKVHEFNIDWDEPLIGPDSLAKIHDTITRIRPKLITTVHCDTPTGSINNCLKEIGEYAREADTVLLMDCVSSFVGLPVLVDVRIGLPSALDSFLNLVSTLYTDNIQPNFFIYRSGTSIWLCADLRRL